MGCRASPLSSQERYQQKTQPVSEGKTLWTAGCPAGWALECRSRLSVTQRGEPYFLALADDQIDAKMKWNTTEEYFQTSNKNEKQNMICLFFYCPGFQIPTNIYSLGKISTAPSSLYFPPQAELFKQQAQSLLGCQLLIREVIITSCQLSPLTQPLWCGY